jgi:hypothetical protein
VLDAERDAGRTAAYEEYDRYMADAYKTRDALPSPEASHPLWVGAGSPDRHAGAQEGDACTIDGAPGHMRQVGGRLENIPDRRSRDSLTGDALKQDAYAEVDWRDQNAWRGEAWLRGNLPAQWR